MFLLPIHFTSLFVLSINNILYRLNYIIECSEQNIMDYKAKNFRQKLNNYQSLAQLPKPFPLNHYPQNSYLTRTNKQASFQSYRLLENAPKNKENSSFYQAALNNRLQLLENRVSAVQTGHYRINNNVDSLLRENRNSIAASTNTPTHSHIFNSTLLGDLANLREELKTHSQKYELLQQKQNKLQYSVQQIYQDQDLHSQAKIKADQDANRANSYKLAKVQQEIETIKLNFSQLQNKREPMGGELYERQSLLKHLSGYKQELSQQYKRDKEMYLTMTKQLKESFTVLKHVIQEDRENIKCAINEVQQNSDTSATQLTHSSQNYHKQAAEKQLKLEKQLATLKKELGQFKANLEQKLQENRDMIIRVQNSTLESLEKEEPVLDTDKFDEFKEQISEWKKQNQQKNLNILRQMANTIKASRSQWQKQTEQLRKDLEEHQKSTKQIKKHLSKELKAQVKELASLMNEQFELMSQQLQNTTQLIGVGKKETESKLSEEIGNLKKQSDMQFQKYRTTLDKTKEQLQAFEKQTMQLVSSKFDSVNADIKNIQSAAQQKMDQFIDSINQQNQDWTNNLNQSLNSLKSSFNSKIQALSTTQKSDIQSLTQQLTQKIQNLNIQFKKQSNSSSEASKKLIMTSLEAERIQNAKNLSKTTNQIMAFVGDLKKSMESKLTQAKNKENQKSNEDQKRYSELKNQLEQSLAKQNKLLQEQLLKMSKKVQSVGTAVKKEFTAQLEKEKKTRDEETKAKLLQLQKKTNEGLIKLKTQIVAQVNKNKTSVLQDQNHLKADIQLKMKGLLDQKQKKQQELKAKEGQLLNKAAEVDKKIDLSASNAKKELLKQINDQLAKIRGQVDTKIVAASQKTAKREAETKAKESEVGKKMDALLANLKKQIISETQKDKKGLHDELQKLSEQNKKIKGQYEAKSKLQAEQTAKNSAQLAAKVQENGKKLQAAKEQLNKKITQIKTMSLSSKLQQTESGKAQEQKIQNLRAQFTKQMKDNESKVQLKLADINKNQSAYRQNFTAAIKQTKQSLNKMEAKSLSQAEKYKAMYDKMATDILDIADSFSTLLSELQPAK